MKTILSILEVSLAIPVGLLSVPFLLVIFLVKAFLPMNKNQGILVRMDNRPELARNAV